MLKPGIDPSTLITSIQRDADQHVRMAALAVEAIGGPDAVHSYLTHLQCTVLGIAVTEQGPGGACQLMADALTTAEQLAEELRC